MRAHVAAQPKGIESQIQVTATIAQNAVHAHLRRLGFSRAAALLAATGAAIPDLHLGGHRHPEMNFAQFLQVSASGATTLLPRYSQRGRDL